MNIPIEAHTYIADGPIHVFITHATYSEILAASERVHKALIAAALDAPKEIRNDSQDRHGS